MAFRHGPHHVAQKSMSTNLPLVSGCGVSHFSTTSSGPFSLITDLAQSFFSSAKAEHSNATKKPITRKGLFIREDCLRPCRHATVFRGEQRLRPSSNARPPRFTPPGLAVLKRFLSPLPVHSERSPHQRSPMHRRRLTGPDSYALFGRFAQDDGVTRFTARCS